MKKHFVEFFSPGTFVSERTRKEISSWSVELAVSMVGNISERHGATPYGFQFLTMESNGWEPEEVSRSGMHWLGGKVFTLKNIEDRNNPEDYVLISNMKNNGFDRIIENNNSWKFTGFFGDDDVLLDYQV